jgi:hypothetical protein
MNNVFPLPVPHPWAPRPPLFDDMTIAEMSYVVPGFFEARDRKGRSLYGKLGVDKIPLWATRVHLNPQEFSRIVENLRPEPNDA